jgi:SAM-dependent methyltransferase
VTPGFQREQLTSRYDVATISEDEWHLYSEAWTRDTVAGLLPGPPLNNNWLLNAGAGVYDISENGWRTVSLDLFAEPIRRHRFPICGNIEQLPFGSDSFAAVVCVGEVLAYCDPAKALRECARVLIPGGRIICDFRSSRSPRYWFTKTHGRAADLVVDQYNGTPEPTWVYDPHYIDSVLVANGLRVFRRLGLHTWSSIAKRAGCSSVSSLYIQNALTKVSLPSYFSDLVTIAADRL